MEYSKTGLALTERFESCRLKSYQDSAGVWTIGWGHTGNIGPFTECTQEDADAWLVQDTLHAVDVVNRLVTVPLTQGEFDALVDFVYNVGEGNFIASTLLELLNEGQYASAADQFLRWDHAGGKEVSGLLRRRVAEQAVFSGAA